ncbi:MAG: DNA-formamidopyrimidine glycosylase family protein, partial [Gemmatimonadaceae bacterium]
MPELPETETIARDLDRMIAGRQVTDVRVLRPDVLRLLSGPAIATQLTGSTIVRSWRRAKSVVLDMVDGHRILVQPRFTGVLSVLGALPVAPSIPHECVRLELDDGRALVYSDVRRLGTFTVATPAQFSDINSTLGVEPLDREFTPDRLSGILRGSGKVVKALLM